MDYRGTHLKLTAIATERRGYRKPAVLRLWGSITPPTDSLHRLSSEEYLTHKFPFPNPIPPAELIRLGKKKLVGIILDRTTKHDMLVFAG